MGRMLITVGAGALLTIVVACGSSSPPNDATPCGDDLCTGSEVCVTPCNEDGCSIPMPSSGQCPAGYLSETGAGACCGVRGPPPHCVVPAQATQEDCAPYGQLMHAQDGEDEPPVFCGCLD